MSIRVRNSNRQVMKVSKHTATITRGRSCAILLGNKIISVQSNGNEHRAFYADATLRQLADSIYAMLEKKNKPKRKPYAKRKTFAERVESYGWKLAV